MYQMHQITNYLYKQAGQEYTVEARIIGFNGMDIEIEFQHPSRNYLMQRWLRTAQDRARLLDYKVPKPGAPIGNQNAVKEGPHRMLVTLSLKDERLEKCATQLKQQDKEITTANLRQLAYDAIDAL